MDPITLMMGAGLLMQGGGLLGSIFGAKDKAENERQQAAIQQQIEAQKHQQMILQSRRMQMENIRNTQLQRSLSLAAATNQGAQFGSGLPGGQAQIQGQSNVNALGISQNTEIGENIYGLDLQTNALKAKSADIQSQMSMYAGLSSFGSSLMTAAPKFGAMMGGFGNKGSSGMSDMSYGRAINMMGRGGIY